MYLKNMYKKSDIIFFSFFSLYYIIYTIYSTNQVDFHLKFDAALPDVGNLLDV